MITVFLRDRPKSYDVLTTLNGNVLTLTASLDVLSLTSVVQCTEVLIQFSLVSYEGSC